MIRVCFHTQAAKKPPERIEGLPFSSSVAGGFRHSLGSFQGVGILLADFVEGQYLVAGGGLRLLDPTTVVADAVPLHIVIEFHVRPA